MYLGAVVSVLVAVVGVDTGKVVGVSAAVDRCRCRCKCR